MLRILLGRLLWLLTWRFKLPLMGFYLARTATSPVELLPQDTVLCSNAHCGVCLICCVEGLKSLPLQRSMQMYLLCMRTLLYGMLCGIMQSLLYVRRYDSTLECVITFTDALAQDQAAAADALLANGTYLGPLHGIPYGLKDLIGVPGYPTTWGAAAFKNQQLTAAAQVYTK